MNTRDIWIGRIAVALGVEYETAKEVCSCISEWKLPRIYDKIYLGELHCKDGKLVKNEHDPISS